ncbi:MAG: hypothetical protein ABIJ37_03100 [Pseudomonadota bacterium]
MYRLKKNVAAFEVVDGPFAGRKYLHGKTYSEIPSQEKEKFEKVRATVRPSFTNEQRITKSKGGKKIEKYISKL